MRRTNPGPLLIAALFLGCADAPPTAGEPSAEPVPADDGLVEKRSRCALDRIRCERTCFTGYGSFWGTLSPLYNACMDECLELYERCSHGAHAQPPGPAGDEPTVSWDQPTSDGVGGYYGYCGPTAAANVAAMLCGADIAPRELASECFSWNPGTTPEHLAATLNGLEDCGAWGVCVARAGLEELHAAAPAPTLLDWGGGSLHWVTVVGVSFAAPCQVWFNHWGRQDRLACADFIERWSLTHTTLGEASVASRLLAPLTYVCPLGAR